jgi:hypothetical protein
MYSPGCATNAVRTIPVARRKSEDACRPHHCVAVFSLSIRRGDPPRPAFRYPAQFFSCEVMGTFAFPVFYPHSLLPAARWVKSRLSSRALRTRRVPGGSVVGRICGWGGFRTRGIGSPTPDPPHRPFMSDNSGTNNKLLPSNEPWSLRLRIPDRGALPRSCP